MLKPARRENHVKAPESWQEIAHGLWLKQQVEAALRPALGRVFGYHFAKSGALAAALAVPQCKVSHQFSVAPSTQVKADVYAEATAWPFAEQSLDAILSVMELEFSNDPHQILREFSYSLINDGTLVLVGLNPLAAHRCRALWPGQRKKYPWNARYFSCARVMDWLALLNFEVCAHHYLAPSMLQQRWLWLEQGMTKASQWLPQLGAGYMIVAKKRAYPLTLLPEKVAKRNLQPKLQTVPVANQTQTKEF
ncbi:methyltransferase domain-containing protein [Pseudidiomarina sediminum]|uniref:Methyltransferase domain-containing protein n=1 Tax=Pseudidiomarina sediminum TaxID=431675 RepID=A0A432Z3J1_9GAMM|nr:methyltransferase domain-containing protein [Pseudidiomarina sediminum]MBY6064768.1 class I SAM-dependent methyltransferase [Pseudidiomarina sediminum]RUO72456.1 methyltransferase domain-containing protein [Pseudidiomarina sediminum]